MRHPLRSLRFAWQIQRFEFLTVIGVSAVLFVLCSWEIARLRAATPDISCFRAWFATASAPAGCDKLFDFFDLLNSEGSQLTGLLTVLPVVIAVILGTTMVSREVEHRTAELSWSLASSRRAWLFDRLWPVLALVAVLCGIAALVGDTLQQATSPWISAATSFDDYGGRGLPLLARGIALTTACLTVGAVVGRQLPGLLLGIAVSVILLFSVGRLVPFGASLVPVEIGDRFAGPLVVTEAYQTPSGALLTRDEARATAPSTVSRGQLDEWVFDHYAIVRLGVVGQQLGEVELREAAIMAVVAGAFLLITIAVVERRRPY